MRLHFILACHNRRELTIAAVRRAAAAFAAAGLNADFVVVDDGSTDGTGEALRTLDTEVTVIDGNGAQFWARSMSIAEKVALNAADRADWIVWLNDDVELDEDAVVRLRSLLQEGSERILVGAMRDPVAGEITYTGLRRSGWHPLSFSPVAPGSDLRPVDTFNGNLVFVPVGVARRLGGIDGGFAHALADIDYGLRSKALGIPAFLAPGTFGTCVRNSLDSSGPIIDRWRQFRSRKGGGEPTSTRRFVLRHAPAKWPWAYFWTTTAWWAREVLRTMRG